MTRSQNITQRPEYCFLEAFRQGIAGHEDEIRELVVLLREQYVTHRDEPDAEGGIIASMFGGNQLFYQKYIDDLDRLDAIITALPSADLTASTPRELRHLMTDVLIGCDDLLSEYSVPVLSEAYNHARRERDVAAIEFSSRQFADRWLHRDFSEPEPEAGVAPPSQ